MRNMKQLNQTTKHPGDNYIDLKASQSDHSEFMAS